MDAQTPTPTPTSTPDRRRAPRGRIALAATTAAVLVAGALAFGAAARTTAADPAESALEERLQSLVDAGYPAALASVTRPDGTSIDVSVGDGDLSSDRETPEDAEVRVGSNTKMFVATVVMQLIEEGAVSLDEPIETYLPGVVTSDGIDGAAITVRDLLRQTSGLPESSEVVATDPFGMQDVYISGRDLLDIALAQPATFAPGDRWEYSNTNYIVLGLLVERVSQRPLWEQIDERIVRPLELDHTYLPVPGERELRGAHVEGYHADFPGELREITDMDPAFGWAAGAVVSTPTEMNRFMQALLGGELVSEESVALMQDTVPADDPFHPDLGYGLGLQTYSLECGVMWGHGGDIPGTQTRNAVAPDGTAVTIAVTALPWAIADPTDEAVLLPKYEIVMDALDETLCDS